MLEIVRNLLTNLGFNVAGIPDLILVIGVILVLVVVLRILHEIVEALVSFGCIIISLLIIIWLLYEVFI